jgi:predicted metal-dependent HD superfamily phosphohydrolase
MTAPELAPLDKRWTALCHRLSPDTRRATIRQQFAKIVQSYLPLPYHNLVHIAACLRELDVCRADVDDADRLEICALAA